MFVLWMKVESYRNFLCSIFHVVRELILVLEACGLAMNIVSATERDLDQFIFVKSI
jgi:hypothetical protein